MLLLQNFRGMLRVVVKNKRSSLYTAVSESAFLLGNNLRWLLKNSESLPDSRQNLHFMRNIYNHSDMLKYVTATCGHKHMQFYTLLEKMEQGIFDSFKVITTPSLYSNRAHLVFSFFLLCYIIQLDYMLHSDLRTLYPQNLNA